jgi:subtilisin family serine protease
VTPPNPAQQILDRMEISNLHADGYKGAGISIALIDSGLLPESRFGGVVDEEIDFSGEESPRHAESHHGNAVASCINLIAPETRLGNFRVFNAQGYAKRTAVVAALQHCIEVFPKYRVANLSLSFAVEGCPDSCILCRKVDEAYRTGIYVVVAAGNEGPEPNTLTCPAPSPWAVVTLATLPTAVNDYWADHPWRRFWVTHVTGEFSNSYGTSYSAGYSSGAAALHLAAFPGLTADTLRFAVTNVMDQLRKEDRQTTSEQRVRDYLLWLQGWSRSGVLFQKRGALHPFLEEL